MRLHRLQTRRHATKLRKRRGFGPQKVMAERQLRDYSIPSTRINPLLALRYATKHQKDEGIVLKTRCLKDSYETSSPCKRIDVQQKSKVESWLVNTLQ
jgi:hypothetical protein